MSPSREPLDADAVAAAAADVPEWTCSTESISRTVKCASFVEAFGLMASVALVAEKMDHHPDWSNVYNTVEIELSTHDAGGVTELDFELASKIDDIATRYV